MSSQGKGRPLPWQEVQALTPYIKKHGIQQFISMMKAMESKDYKELKWGDETEYILVKFDHEKKRVYLHCIANEYLDRLAELQTDNPVTFMEEYGSFMIESCPAKPFLSDVGEFNRVLEDMKHRRKVISKLMDEDTETMLTITHFPRLGCPDSTWPFSQPSPNGTISQSIFLPDECINPRLKMQTVTRNMRLRRGNKSVINVPIYKDTNTPDPFIEFPEIPAAKPDHIYMDCPGFGGGSCCLQVTFQACDIDEAKMLYDQFAALSPILMALSAAAPIYRGYLSDRDCRWSMISESWDDRTDEEIQNPAVRSRHSCINSYLKSETLSDMDPPYDMEMFKTLMNANVKSIDTLLAQHIAHIFTRDPLQAFSNRIQLDDERDSDHFENIQCTNWQNVRFKPPPHDSDIGFRIEVRTLEVQITDFENAAFASLCILLSRAIASAMGKFCMPLSLVHINMQRAQRRNAVRDQMFYFRKNIQCCKSTGCECVPEITEMTIDDIINGREGYPGICGIIQEYVDDMDFDFRTAARISSYLCLIKKRACSELMTAASWMRKFVQSHPLYKHDSVVSDEVTYNLLMECRNITNGKHCPEILGSLREVSEFNGAENGCHNGCHNSD